MVRFACRASPSAPKEIRKTLGNNVSDRLLVHADLSGDGCEWMSDSTYQYELHATRGQPMTLVHIGKRLKRSRFTRSTKISGAIYSNCNCFSARRDISEINSFSAMLQKPPSALGTAFGHDDVARFDQKTIRKMGMVAIGRVVLTSREHIIALEPLGKGLIGNLLRYPNEVRDEKDYFDDIQDVKITKDMLDLAQHIVEGKSAEFEPEKFEDHYETALVELINQKRAGQPIKAPAPSRTSGNVVDLMDALRKSIAGGGREAATATAKKGKKRAAGQKEMLLPISGEGEGRHADRKKAAKPARSSARSRKAS